MFSRDKSILKKILIRTTQYLGFFAAFFAPNSFVRGHEENALVTNSKGIMDLLHSPIPMNNSQIVWENQNDLSKAIEEDNPDYLFRFLEKNPNELRTLRIYWVLAAENNCIGVFNAIRKFKGFEKFIEEEGIVYLTLKKSIAALEFLQRQQIYPTLATGFQLLTKWHNDLKTYPERIPTYAEALELLLKQKFPINDFDKANSMMTMAMRSNNLMAAEILLKNGFSIYNYNSNDKVWDVFTAVDKNKFPFFELFLKEGLDLVTARANNIPVERFWFEFEKKLMAGNILSNQNFILKLADSKHANKFFDSFRIFYNGHKVKEFIVDYPYALGKKGLFAKDGFLFKTAKYLEPYYLYISYISLSLLLLVNLPSLKKKKKKLSQQSGKTYQLIKSSYQSIKALMTTKKIETQVANTLDEEKPILESKNTQRSNLKKAKKPINGKKNNPSEKIKKPNKKTVANNKASSAPSFENPISENSETFIDDEKKFENDLAIAISLSKQSYGIEESSDYKNNEINTATTDTNSALSPDSGLNSESFEVIEDKPNTSPLNLNTESTFASTSELELTLSPTKLVDLNSSQNIEIKIDDGEALKRSTELSKSQIYIEPVLLSTPLEINQEKSESKNDITPNLPSVTNPALTRPLAPIKYYLPLTAFPIEAIIVYQKICELGGEIFIGGSTVTLALQNHLFNTNYPHPAKADIDCITNLDPVLVKNAYPDSTSINEGKLIQTRILERSVDICQSESLKNILDIERAIAVDASLRDFTVCSAVAKIVEPQPGVFFWEITDSWGLASRDILANKLVSINDPEVSFIEEPSRMLRAIYYHLNKNFVLDPAILSAIANQKERLAAMPSYKLSTVYKLLNCENNIEIWQELKNLNLVPQFIDRLNPKTMAKVQEVEAATILKLAQEEIERQNQIFAEEMKQHQQRIAGSTRFFKSHNSKHKTNSGRYKSSSSSLNSRNFSKRNSQGLNKFSNSNH